MDTIGFWMNAAGSRPMIPHKRIVEIARKMQTLDPQSIAYRKCVGKIVEHNLRLVISYVYKYVTKKTLYSWGSQESLDMLQAGCLGLVRAAEKYNPESGFKFSTYAVPWIGSFVGRVKIKAASPFIISEEAVRRACYYVKHGKGLLKKSGRQPSDDESKNLAQMVYAAQFPFSLEAETSKSDSGMSTVKLADIISSEYATYKFDDGCFIDEIEEAMKEAGLSEQQVLVLRGTFIENKKNSEICEAMGFDAETLVRLKSDAIDRLRPILAPL